MWKTRLYPHLFGVTNRQSGYPGNVPRIMFHTTAMFPQKWAKITPKVPEMSFSAKKSPRLVLHNVFSCRFAPRQKDQ